MSAFAQRLSEVLQRQQHHQPLHQQHATLGSNSDASFAAAPAPPPSSLQTRFNGVLNDVTPRLVTQPQRLRQPIVAPAPSPAAAASDADLQAQALFNRITFTCIPCGAKHQTGSHCSSCHAALPLLTQCPQCKAMARGRFCSSCGQRLDEDTASPSRRRPSYGAPSPQSAVAPSVPNEWHAVDAAWRDHARHNRLTQSAHA
jgi:hypothetical protein